MRGHSVRLRVLRLRLGISLIVLSWMPFAQVGIWIAHNNGKLESGSSATTFRAVVWGIQVVVGLIGVALVGKLAIDEAKKAGWKKTPRRLWELFRHGPDETP